MIISLKHFNFNRMYKTHNFKELQIWKEGMSIVKEIYRYTSNLPESKRFGLTSQLNRCCISLPANITEGSGRTSIEFERFLRISLSSSYELETLLTISNDLFEKVDEELFTQINTFQNKTKAFIKSLKTKEV